MAAPRRKTGQARGESKPRTSMLGSDRGQRNCAFIASPLVVPYSRSPSARCRKPLRSPPSMRVPSDPLLHTKLAAWGVQVDPDDVFGASITAVSTDPPLLRIANFLTDAQCDALIALQSAATQESDLYLNYRVNREVSEASAAAGSGEAEHLIAEFASSRATLNASMRSGFRAHVAAHADELQPVLDATRAALGFGERAFVFEEGLWRRPNRRCVVVRDQTTVRYEVGEGVAPHVDGKDATVLVCLQAPRSGGRTVFPEEDVAVTPVKGAALVYRSKKGLLHFAEAVADGQKWVLQLLIDFRIRADEPDVDFGSGRVFS